MKNGVRKIFQKALESLWNLLSSERYLNDFYWTDTKLAPDKDGRNFRLLQIFIQ